MAVKEPGDVYNDIASARRVSRTVAKQDLLAAFYTYLKNCSVPEAWNLPDGHYAIGLMDAVDSYRQLLWERGAPRGRTRRHVYTLLGRKIQSSPGGKRRPHRGSMLSWHLQGSLADIFNEKLRRLLALHHAGNLRFLLQQYDGFYVACSTPSWCPELVSILESDIPLDGLALKAVAKEL